jgi:hypothetical protein
MSCSQRHVTTRSDTVSHVAIQRMFNGHAYATPLLARIWRRSAPVVLAQ